MRGLSNCEYPQFELRISTIRIIDIGNLNCGYRQLLISAIRIVDIDNLNCGYRQ